MRKRNLLSTLLAMLLVFNTSCACAAMVADSDAAPHAHHEQPAGDTAPGADCHPDCEDCEKAAGVGLGKDKSQPLSLKFGLDDIEWSAINMAPYVLGGTTSSTGPPESQLFLTANTPVRRFDLQIE